jgi:hypothetical protein
MIITIHHPGGAPGSTTIASLIAHYWPTPGASTLIEADPAGGVLAARWQTAHNLHHEPGLLTLAAARTGTPNGDLVDTCTQTMGNHSRIVAAPPTPLASAAAIDVMIDRHLAALADDPEHVFILDLGRTELGNPRTIACTEAATIRVIVTGNRLEDINRIINDPHRKAGLFQRLVIRDHPNGYQPHEVAKRLGISHLATLPTDPAAAHRWDVDGPKAGRRFDRAPLGQAAETLSHDLARLMNAPTAIDAGTAAPWRSRPPVEVSHG